MYQWYTLVTGVDGADLRWNENFQVGIMVSHRMDSLNSRYGK
jgi:hypothetical protein